MKRLTVLLLVLLTCGSLALPSLGIRLHAQSADTASIQREPPLLPCRCEARTYAHSYAFGPKSGHWSRTVTLPDTGRFVEESHYVTTQDTFPDGRLFADSAAEHIPQHLERSLALYRQWDSTAVLDSLYANRWQRVWTPAERGHIGQGSVGDVQAQELTPEMELWMMNMMWAKDQRPPRGTRFLLQANGRAVVVVAGYETGPGQQRFLGGVTPEVHAWLGTSDEDQIVVSYLVDQQAPVGPVRCEAPLPSDHPSE